MSLYSGILNELDYGEFLRKQRSITHLFPTFYNRVRKVAEKGGVELVGKFPELWHFKVTSARLPGVRYDNYVRFKNVVPMLRRFAADTRLWNKDKTNVDYRLLAAEVLNELDLEADCSCPADTYYGPEYLKTKRNAQFGDQENRPPDIRNPKQYGLVCKHKQLILDVLPMYTATFAKFLRDFYKEDIQAIVDAALKQRGAIKQAAGELGKRAEPKLRKYARGEFERPPKDEVNPAKPTPKPIKPIGTEGPEVSDKDKKGKYNTNG